MTYTVIEIKNGKVTNSSSSLDSISEATELANYVVNKGLCDVASVENSSGIIEAVVKP